MSEPKAKIAVSIDADLARRIDEIVEARGENRSRVVEQIIKDGIAEQETFLKAMENPVTRTIFAAIAKNPTVLRGIAQLVGEQMDEDRVTEISENADRETKRGRTRRASKKKGKASPRNRGIAGEALNA